MDVLPRLYLRRLRRSQPVRRWPTRLVASALAAVLGGSGVLLLLPQSVQAQAEGLLSLGQTNRDVEALQQQLIALGFLDASTPTGYYGEQTEAAVLQFQAARGLFQDGVAGPETLAALNLLGRGGDLADQWLDRGAAGDRLLNDRAMNDREIQTLQDRLLALGYDPGEPDGVLGPQTATALERFQRDYDLRADRRVTTSTLEQVTRVFDRQRSPDRRVSLGELNTTLPAPVPGLEGPTVAIPLDAWERRDGSLAPSPGGPPWVQPAPGWSTVGGQVAQVDSQYPYVIAVPGESDRTLRQVQAVVPGAFANKDPRRGSYVRAGAFATRAEAEAEERYLRSKGLDARVIFLQ